MHLAALAVLLAAPFAAQSPLYTFHGDSPNDEFGVAVAGAGDVNWDGYDDVIVGAHWDDDKGTDSGSAKTTSGLRAVCDLRWGRGQILLLGLQALPRR